MGSMDKIYLIALAIFATAFLSINPYPFEFILAGFILLVMGILIRRKKKSHRDS